MKIMFDMFGCTEVAYLLFLLFKLHFDAMFSVNYDTCDITHMICFCKFVFKIKTVNRIRSVIMSEVTNNNWLTDFLVTRQFFILFVIHECFSFYRKQTIKV